MLLPGMDGTGELFAPFLTELGPEIRSVIIRYPNDEFLDYPALTELVSSKLPTTTTEPFVLLAESFSGPIAISLAARRPVNLVGLILCASFASSPRPVIGPLHRYFPSTWAYRLSPRFAAVLMLNGVKSDELKRQLLAAVKQVDAKVLRARMEAILSVDVRDDLARIEVPSLYFRASKDRLVPKRAAIQIKSSTDHWKLYELHAPHLLLQVTPRQVALIVKTFLEKLVGEN